MARALEQEQENYRSRLFHFKGMNDNATGPRHTKSMSADVESTSGFDCEEEEEKVVMDARVASRSYGGKPLNDMERQQSGSVFIPNDKGPRSRFSKDEAAASKEVVKEGQSSEQYCISFFLFQYNAKSPIGCISILLKMD